MMASREWLFHVCEDSQLLFYDTYPTTSVQQKSAVKEIVFHLTHTLLGENIYWQQCNDFLLLGYRILECVTWCLICCHLEASCWWCVFHRMSLYIFHNASIWNYCYDIISTLLICNLAMGWEWLSVYGLSFWVEMWTVCVQYGSKPFWWRLTGISIGRGATQIWLTCLTLTWTTNSRKEFCVCDCVPWLPAFDYCSLC